ncbi:sugar phosphate isomerase/epimerase family protein [Brachybacterium sp. AOP43-C2-M15]|uniref:sugar phosphate isomerase/epimerase family protein n=1 Tax=Brachybacterium sp. AOP43-C2-M15 TaxID=3457661 RepID=UPI004034A522
MSTLRIATAPISWGVSEVEGWGVQLPPERVLTEMRELGFDATELGAEGFLPPAPEDKAHVLAEYGLTAIGSFVPVGAHQADVDPLPRVEQELADYAASGADVLVLATVTGATGYDDTREPLTPAQWSTLLANLERIREAAAAQGVTAVLHPHVGTVVETAEDIQAVLEGSTIPFCFDTGHLMIGGTDPVRFAAEHADRIAYMHLKDVSLEGMRRVKDGEISYFDAIVEDSLYRPVGEGDVDVRAILTSLVDSGFDGWIVLEQDKVVREEPAAGEGPVLDARTSVENVRRLVAEIEAARS